MNLYCIKEYELISDNFKCGVKKGNFYKMTDEDNIGYRIIDDLNRNYWVIKSCFLNPEETRELKLNLIPLTTDMFNLKEKVFNICNGNSMKLAEWKHEDILKILLEEKPGLSSYDKITILSVEKAYDYGTSFVTRKENTSKWLVSINCYTGTFLAGGTEEIDSLDLKIRDLKLQQILY
jgi:hypothetical protein